MQGFYQISLSFFLLFLFNHRWFKCIILATYSFRDSLAVRFAKFWIFFFAKIECGLYFLDRFDVLMLKMIFKK